MSAYFGTKFKQVFEHIKHGVDKISPCPQYYPFIMSESEKALFDNRVKNARHYLEFGLGGSTLRAIQKSRAHIYTVESSLDWIAKMREYFSLRYAEKKRVTLIPVDIGPTGNWGYPESDESEPLYESYSSNVFATLDAKHLDLILIDGRFRVACILRAVLACAANHNVSIMVHDFWNREHYHRVLKYLDLVDKTDTLGVFSIKSDVDINAAQKDYELYKNDPR